MIEITVNTRLGQKCRVRCEPTDVIGDVKKLIAAMLGSPPESFRLQKGHCILKDHIDLDTYEVQNGTELELYFHK